MVSEVIRVYIEIAGDDEFMRCGCSGGEKRCEFTQKGRERFRECGGCGRALCYCRIKKYLRNKKMTANDYRLQQIIEIQRQLELERAKCEKLSENYHKSLKAVDATKSVLL